MVDPLSLSLSIASSLVANVLTKTIEEVAYSWAKEAAEPPLEIDIDRVESAINRQLRTLKPADLLPEEAPKEDVEAVTKFLASRDLAYVTADAVAMYLLHMQAKDSEELTTRCSRLLVAHGISHGSAYHSTSKVLELVQLVANEAVGALPLANETKGTKVQARRAAAYRRLHQRQVERLSDQLAIVISLIDREEVDMAKLNNHVHNLRNAVSSVHSKITPPSLDSATPVSVDALYVAPSLVATSHYYRVAEVQSPGTRTVSKVLERKAIERAYSLPMDLQALLQANERMVILGNPGAGKTTFANYLARSVCNGEAQLAAEVAIPITLRQLPDSLVTEAGIDVMDAIAFTAKNRYQVELTRSEVAFLCATARLLVVIDGLDELLETQHRTSVRDSIQAFAAINMRCPIVVTSRIVGYSQAQLDHDLFSEALISPFTEYQVTSYAKKWFSLHEELTTSQRDTLAHSFIQETNSAQDLRENPLMLSLICGLYRHQRYIPRNRPQIYASCSRLLFDTWDRRRSLRPAFEFDAHVNGAIQYIAHWVFSDQSRQRGVAQPDLVRVAADYLNEWQYVRRPEATAAAEEFIEFCKGRAWILTDTGSMGDGVALFQFTHRTFLEYITAVHLCQTLSEDQLVGVLAYKCSDPSWNVVCQILLQLAPQKRRRLEERAIGEIFQRFPSLEPTEKEIAINVCNECLGSLPLRPETVTSVARKSLDQYLVRLRRAPVGAPDSMSAAAGRSVFWLDSSKIAVENLRAAGEVVRERLNKEIAIAAGRMERSGIEKAAAHLYEFFFTPQAAPSDLSNAFTQASKEAVVDRLQEKPEPWLESVALLSGFVPKDVELRDYHLGRKLDLSPWPVPWGNSAAPNLVEVVVWYSIRCSQSETPFLERVLAPLAMRLLNRMPTDYSGVTYDPHWWWRSRIYRSATASAHAVREAELPEPVGVVATASALLLCELYLAGVPNETEVLAAEELISSDWGNLRYVAPALAERYAMTIDKPQRTDHYLTASGIVRWCRKDMALLDSVADALA